ncbi:hypothetical protein DFR75_10357 [Nocardia ignorata]|uniref:ArsR family transcriptional regulator n=1 Tax=Nocardia ignorata TaxID=145285 RepID=A0A4R6PL72_NOCIG|nr:hypothetical protein DFR75_10357 [Nocardia ignorata]
MTGAVSCATNTELPGTRSPGRDEPACSRRSPQATDGSRQAVSQHLRVLKEGGLVVATPDGTKRIYRINPDGLAAIQAYFQNIWDQALTAFQKAADAAATDLEQENRP